MTAQREIVCFSRGGDHKLLSNLFEFKDAVDFGFGKFYSAEAAYYAAVLLCSTLKQPNKKQMDKWQEDFARVKNGFCAKQMGKQLKLKLKKQLNPLTKQLIMLHIASVKVNGTERTISIPTV